MSKLSRKWVAVLAAAAILAPRHQLLHAQTATPADDSLLVRAVLESVLGNMGGELAGVVRSGTPIPWTLRVPNGSEWARNADGLRRLLNARDVRSQDTSYYTLDIERTSRGDSAATFDVGIGFHFHCPRDQVHWIGSGKSFQIAARRIAGKYWSITNSLVVMSDPAECP